MNLTLQCYISVKNTDFKMFCLHYYLTESDLLLGLTLFFESSTCFNYLLYNTECTVCVYERDLLCVQVWLCINRWLVDN